MANQHDPSLPNAVPRRRRRYGTGPPAAMVITWAILSDPALRSALEFGAASAETARHRVYTFRRRARALAVALAVVAATAQLILWAIG